MNKYEIYLKEKLLELNKNNKLDKIYKWSKPEDISDKEIIYFLDNNKLYIKERINYRDSTDFTIILGESNTLDSIAIRLSYNTSFYEDFYDESYINWEDISIYKASIEYSDRLEL